MRKYLTETVTDRTEARYSSKFRNPMRTDLLDNRPVTERLDIMAVRYANAKGEVVTAEVPYEDYSGSEASSVAMMDRSNDVYEADLTDSGEYVKDDGRYYDVKGDLRNRDGSPVLLKKDRDWNLSLDDNGDVTIFAAKTGWYVRGAGKCRIQICEYEQGWVATCSCGNFRSKAEREVTLSDGTHGPLTYEQASQAPLFVSKWVALHAAKAYNETVGRRSHVDYDL